ncbi:MAG: glycoside hydrolase family 95 protein [Clostridiales bacterium]|jgi:alpha-L-fucosidase 2|nr:glycoside hydrolase family 95 protein [Clostridiales bacterium]
MLNLNSKNTDIKNILKFEKPPLTNYSKWREALPAGNGLIGAYALGNAGKDTVMITHSRLSWQGNISVLPDISTALKDLKKLVKDGKYEDAGALYPKLLQNKGYRPQTSTPLPLCDLKTSIELSEPAADYARYLNMDNGEISVLFKDGKTTVDKSLFVSRTNDMLLYEINKSGGGKINAVVSLSLHDTSSVKLNPAKVPDIFEIKTENQFIFFAAKSDNGKDFGAVAKVVNVGGTSTFANSVITIKGAECVTVYVKVFVDSKRDTEFKNIKAELYNNKLTYDKLLKEHTVLHQKLLKTAEIDLDAEDSDAPIEELLLKAGKGDIPHALIEKLWRYGRYLFVSSGGRDGIVKPAGLWYSDYKTNSPFIPLNGELQFVYYQALTGNMTPLLLPLFDYFDKVYDDLKKNALRLYNAKGIFIPAVMSTDTGLPGNFSREALYFTGAAGIVAFLYYEYYLFTEDVKFLKTRALPFMKDVAAFYEDFFKLGDGNKYESIPSYSPNGKGVTAVYASSDADFIIARQLFSNLIEGAEITKTYPDEVLKWKEVFDRLPVPEVENGKIKEYHLTKIADFDVKYFPQLYSVNPMREISFSTGQSELQPYIDTARHIMTDGLKKQSSLSLAYNAYSFFGLGLKEEAKKCLNYIVRNLTLNNLMTTDADIRGYGIGTDDELFEINIGGNLACTLAIQEMFVSSDDTSIRLFNGVLPSLVRGAITGLSAKGAVSIDINWDREKRKSLFEKGSFEITFKAKKAKTIELYIPEFLKDIRKAPENLIIDDGVIHGIHLTAGKEYIIDFKL